ncbi:universal stress protein [Devosia naphthalenivorans]|uniref:universal stress protein n=1 Tax=Devosia naphthalenivorans TaxID=2082392 RepID=UPI000D3BFA57|nr:universal stress protein [Devosia naphthalenivorans]
MEKETIRRFIERADLPQVIKDGVVPLVEHGPPSQMLQEYGAEHESDVTVIGAYERGRLFHSLIGGQGPRILETFKTDILVVRPQPLSQPRA